MKRVIVYIADNYDLSKVYYTFNDIGFYAAILLGFLHSRKLKVRVLKAVPAIAVERLLTGYVATFVLFVENGFQPPQIANAVVAFPYIPLLGWVLSKLLRCSWKEMWDMLMPIPLIMFVGARISCTVCGCCRGYPCSWGIYNVAKGDFLIPVQLMEALVTILILVAAYRREKRNGFVPDGRNVPMMLISYGIARFILEFLHDNEKIVAGLASTQFHCLIMIAVGVLCLRIIQRSEQNLEEVSMEEITTPEES